MKRIKQEQHIEIEEKSQQLKFRIFVVSIFTHHKISISQHTFCYRLINLVLLS